MFRFTINSRFGDWRPVIQQSVHRQISVITKTLFELTAAGFILNNENTSSKNHYMFEQKNKKNKHKSLLSVTNVLVILSITVYSKRKKKEIKKKNTQLCSHLSSSTTPGAFSCSGTFQLAPKPAPLSHPF